MVILLWFKYFWGSDTTYQCNHPPVLPSWGRYAYLYLYIHSVLFLPLQPTQNESKPFFWSFKYLKTIIMTYNCPVTEPSLTKTCLLTSQSQVLYPSSSLMSWKILIRSRSVVVLLRWWTWDVLVLCWWATAEGTGAWGEILSLKSPRREPWVLNWWQQKQELWCFTCAKKQNKNYSFMSLTFNQTYHFGAPIPPPPLPLASCIPFGNPPTIPEFPV